MMKRLLQELNRAIGLLLCCCVSVSLPYYAAWTGVTYFESYVHPVTLLHVYGFFLLFFIALTLAADINKKVRLQFTIQEMVLKIMKTSLNLTKVNEINDIVPVCI
jgi:hypothetical protein